MTPFAYESLRENNFISRLHTLLDCCEEKDCGTIYHWSWALRSKRLEHFSNFRIEFFLDEEEDEE